MRDRMVYDAGLSDLWHGVSRDLPSGISTMARSIGSMACYGSPAADTSSMTMFPGRALCNYNARSSSELSLSAAEALFIGRSPQPNFYDVRKAESGGASGRSRGLVPVGEDLIALDGGVALLSSAFTAQGTGELSVSQGEQVRPCPATRRELDREGAWSVCCMQSRVLPGRRGGRFHGLHVLATDEWSMPPLSIAVVHVPHSHSRTISAPSLKLIARTHTQRAGSEAPPI